MIERLTSYEVLALSMYLSGSQESHTVLEIQRQPGELITLIEDDKRAGGENPLSVVLPYIRRHLDRDHQIGHSYFLTVAKADEGERVDVLEFVWNNQILPLLGEYFYSQRGKLAELLARFRTDVESEGEPDQIDGMDFKIGRQTGDDLIVALATLADKVHNA